MLLVRSSLLLKEALIGWQVRVPEYVLYLWKISKKRKLEPAEETMSLKGDPSLAKSGNILGLLLQECWSETLIPECIRVQHGYSVWLPNLKELASVWDPSGKEGVRWLQPVFSGPASWPTPLLCKFLRSDSILWTGEIGSKINRLVFEDSHICLSQLPGHGQPAWITIFSSVVVTCGSSALTDMFPKVTWLCQGERTFFLNNFLSQYEHLSEYMTQSPMKSPFGLNYQYFIKA